MLVGYAMAVFAAFAFGYSAVLQAQGAHRAFEEGDGRVGALLRQPRLLVGVALDFAAWLAGRAALVFLPLFAVQAVLAGSVAVTVLLASLLLGVRVSVCERNAMVATCVSLVVIGFVAVPNHDGEVGAAVRVGVVVALPVLAVAGVAAGRRCGAVTQAVLAGLASVGGALAVRSVPFDDGWLMLFMSPVAWTVVGYALCSTWLQAVALGQGGAGQVSAAMWSTEVAVAVLCGVLWLGETVRSGWVVPAAAAFVAVLVSTVVLARSSAGSHLTQSDCPLIKLCSNMSDGDGCVQPGRR
jgi:hypothetical protein